MVTRYARIGRGALPRVLDAWNAAHEVFAPAVRDGVSGFHPLASGAEARPAPWLTSIPVKELFFPRSECLYRYRHGPGGALEFEETARSPGRPRVVFGVRPCDARALALLDRVFRHTDAPDPHYCARREGTALVGVACAEPRSVCFCTSVGGGPFGEEGLDALLVEAGGGYVARLLTPRGEALFADAPEEPRERAEALIAEARARAEAVMPERLPPGGLKGRLEAGFDDAVWDRIHEACIGCGVCAFLCPTCHCFDLTHEADPRSAAGDEGRCVRGWDTCQFPLFTRQASGRNPRPTGRERVRQRLMHKFRYFVDSHGEAACVGCGRCIACCPSSCDIRDALAAVRASTGPGRPGVEG